ncbi:MULTISPECIES: 16S rRNA (uracil(1498)-N(3))-methyltransferase [unclassified Pedobacter]|uniref:16S rRNA (uracil(1498)-N(3))-methyltransferase n=1 Tax=unclassified Pedobacter TaxID=2628915 RepID=UPI001D94F3A2|nr:MULTISPECIES: 16S rRNA (uracil(1498)-N(3))-methyltransferase [unclassified Pedobacter]CAH0164623.1 Ribosomal RNA small subunit methyltransferase E [Pedobacter sp. Bi36]CAH0220503.1 Ribosomal RNA small subunit methyltransferase E [Pedobacter sp. Bi126]
MHIFYTPDITQNTYTLNEEESKHCVRVLRLAVGSIVNLVDGKGGFYTAEITSDNPKKVSLSILKVETEFHKRNHYLHIAVAPTKNIDRIEWFLEKATELGIDEITPIITDRSERRVVKEDRLNKVITSAVKQSIKAYHPKLNDAISFDTFLKEPFDGDKLIAHCIDNGEKQYISKLVVPHQKYLILIGPEGDFTPDEVNLALNKGFKALTLGDNRLRTETAALSVCFEINYLNR